MRFSSYKPTSFLSDFVDIFWLYEGYGAEHQNEARILPTGTFELVINLRENELRIYSAAEEADSCACFSGAVLSGAYGKGIVCDPEEESLIGVHFKPGGAAPFLGFSASELADAHVDLESLWGPSANILRERLCDAATAAERFSLLEDALKNHLLGPMEHHYAVSTALDTFMRKATTVVQNIAKDVGLSERRFIEVFKKEVGLTPKLFSRVLRFQKARAIIHRQEDAIDWTRIGMECGYFDQSHLIRDFLEFSGVSPSAYLREYNRFLDRNINIKRYHLPLFSKLGQFYPIQVISCDAIISLGGDYDRK